MSASLIPTTSAPQSGRPSLYMLPTELRLEIWVHLLDLNNTPHSYAYTGSPPSTQDHPRVQAKPHRQKTRKHSVLYVSKQLSAEYQQCFYERTTFFLRIYSNNAFQALPALSRNPPPVCPEVGAFNFWRASAAMLHNLRHCTLYIELGEIASHVDSMRRVSKTRGQPSYYQDKSLEHPDLDTQDGLFDEVLFWAVHELLGRMHQLQYVQLVWNTATLDVTSAGCAFPVSATWAWNFFGEPFVQMLKLKETMSAMNVKVSDRWKEWAWVGELAEDEWKGGLMKWENGKTIQ